jgi:hypothetical protein
MKKVSLLFLFSFFVLISNAQQKATSSSDSKVSVTFAAGPSFRLAEVPGNTSPLIKAYIQDLKSGFSFDLGLSYMVTNSAGLGLKANLYKSSGAIGSLNLTAPNGDTGFGTASDDISIFYVGPTYTFLGKEGKNKDRFTALFSIGYTSYLNETNVLGNYDIKGSSLGINAEMAYYVTIVKNFQIAPRIALFGGGLRELKITGENGYNRTLDLGDNFESLWRLDPSVSLKYKF